MALKITEKNGIVYLKGRINSTTSKSFSMHLMSYTSIFKKITIDIDKVKEIDADGLNAIKSLWKTSNTHKMKFSIKGYGCKEVYDYLGLSS